jgi:[acyl-carrier-protein] S-malonyltransferase
MLAFLFPGQGTQHVGMGQWLHHAYAEARDVFERASELLGYAIADVCFKGPPARLTSTQFAQPAVFTCGAAGLEVLRRHDVHPEIVAGHSVGEFTALVAAGVMGFDDALAAVNHRAALMAGTRRPGTMAAVIGLAPDTVEGICAQARETGPVRVALYNGERHIVVSGAVTAVEAACDLAREAGALKVRPLSVSHAFHSELMDEITGKWATFVSALALDQPRVPIVLNTTGDVATDVNEIRTAMIDQVSRPVQWVKTVNALRARGIDSAVEVGDSKALCSFTRDIDRSIRTFTLAQPGAVERVRVEYSHAL